MLTAIPAPVPGQAALQPPEQFITAVDDESSSIPFIMITIIDDRDGSSRVTCQHPIDVLYAMAIERGESFDQRQVAVLRDELRRNATHVIHLRTPAAIARATIARDSERAYAIIRRGHAAITADLTGELLEEDRL